MGRTRGEVCQLLAASDPAVRQTAAKAPGELETPAAVAPLAMTLGNGDPGVRQAASDALERLGEGTLAASVRDALRGDSGALLQSRDPRAVAALARAMEGGWDAQGRAAIAFGRMVHP
ncbi:MAG: HEAT repeat domain-containing protein, partial [Armatimonadetes bacterium]|nr:HEAT repeat domain-containing protein [Armatimonadota bacterium]